MDIRKLTAITLITVANILLLVHVILPHFHHDGMVCFVSRSVTHVDCCESACSNASCSACQHTAKNTHHASSDDCSMKNTVLRQANYSLQHAIMHDVCCLSDLYYSAYLLNILFMEEPDFGLTFRERPYLQTYDDPFLGSSQSLRAPPAYFLV